MDVLRSGTRVVGVCVLIGMVATTPAWARPNPSSNPPPPAPPYAERFRDPYQQQKPYNLAELTEDQYQSLLTQLKDQHLPGIVAGMALLFGGTSGIAYLGYRRFSKSRCDLSLLSKLRIASPSLLSIVSGIYMIRYTQLSYNQQKLLIANLRNAIATTPIEQIETLQDLLREFFSKQPL